MMRTTINAVGCLLSITLIVISVELLPVTDAAAAAIGFHRLLLIVHNYVVHQSAQRRLPQCHSQRIDPHL